MRFAAEDPGSVVLVAWADSLVSAREAGDPVPTSGLRLVAGPDSWQLTIYDKRPDVVESGTFEPVTGAAQFELTGPAARVWVVAPDKSVTEVDVPDGRALAGPVGLLAAARVEGRPDTGRDRSDQRGVTSANGPRSRRRDG